MNQKKRIAIIGATSEIAKQCAKIWSQQDGIMLTLVGRNIKRLEALASDLEVRNPKAQIDILQSGFIAPKEIEYTVKQIFCAGPINTVLIAHGMLPQQEECEQNLALCKETLEVNGISSVLFAEAFAMQMSATKHGTIAVIGSVAGDRGRKSNYVYGAAKGLVTRYVQGLQHRFAGSGVRVILIKPGPTSTPMTAMLEGKFANASEVALDITKGIEKKQAVIYTPRKWRLIMMIVRHLPGFIFNKINI